MNFLIRCRYKWNEGWDKEKHIHKVSKSENALVNSGNESIFTAKPNELFESIWSADQKEAIEETNLSAAHRQFINWVETKVIEHKERKR